MKQVLLYLLPIFQLHLLFQQWTSLSDQLSSQIHLETLRHLETQVPMKLQPRHLSEDQVYHLQFITILQHYWKFLLREPLIVVLRITTVLSKGFVQLINLVKNSMVILLMSLLAPIFGNTVLKLILLTALDNQLIFLFLQLRSLVLPPTQWDHSANYTLNTWTLQNHNQTMSFQVQCSSKISTDFSQLIQLMELDHKMQVASPFTKRI